MGSTVFIILLVLVWGGALVMFILAFTTKSAQQVLAERIHRELEREENELILKEQRDEEMQKPLLQRVLTPIFTSLGNRFKKKGPQHAGGIEEMLEQAGHPLGLNAGSFVGLQLFAALSAGGIGPISMPFLGPMLSTQFADVLGGLTYPLLMGMSFVGAAVGFMLPKFMIGRSIKGRRRAMSRAMADTVDLITLSLEAGVGFDGAVGYAVKNTKGPLSEELARVMNEVAAGKSQAESFRDMAVRAKMPELSLLVAAIDQSMRLGVNLAASLRAQATEIRERRAAFCREQAAKLPVKMIFPLVFCIFPALFIVILGPAAIQMKEVSDTGVI